MKIRAVTVLPVQKATAIRILKEREGRHMVVRKRSSCYSYEPESLNHTSELAEAVEFVSTQGIPHMGGWILIPETGEPPVYVNEVEFHAKWRTAL
jgi:hypothetical protein